MKVLLSYVVFFILTLSNLSIAGSIDEKSQGNPELIVAFEKYTPKLAVEFNSAISSLEGIREIGSCEKMNIVYFSYDPTIYKTQEEAFDAIEKATKSFNPLLKIGSSSTEVEGACAQ